MNLVSIDFETANRYRFSPCAVGIVVANETGIIDEFYSLINPLMDFDSQNIYVHGITEVDVADAPTFDELWPILNRYLDKNVIVAHNASFDMSVLRAALDRYLLAYPEIEYLCSVMISKQAWPGLINYKLNTLAALKGIEFSHHNALEDARAVVELLIKAKHEFRVSTIQELIQRFNITSGQLYEKGYKTPKLHMKKRVKLT
ncbi:3'-5' exonuclease [Aquibacillus sediminis]|uniref:3'-5' exonuclease n=1 Tax=Aquibacillus sediminis TaxID=2574734 RepID=UPI0011084A1E|nr:3'-5' exonuclease [Aquibacillus sediminis]